MGTSAVETEQTEVEVEATGAPAAVEAHTPPAEAPATPAAPVVPEKYELVLPKDSVLPAAVLERTATIARQLGLSNEAAQKVLDSFTAEAASLEQARAAAWEPGKGDAWKARNAEWETAALKDAEIGGTPEKLKVSVDKAQSVLGKFFPPDVMDFLQASGLGSHPGVIKGLAKIGSAFSEGTLNTGAPPSNIAPKTLAERLYGNTPNNTPAAA